VQARTCKMNHYADLRCIVTADSRVHESLVAIFRDSEGDAEQMKAKLKEESAS
jgi:hypothetical protein